MTTYVLNDSFTGSAGVLAGRVAPTGQTWTDTNDAVRLDGSGRLIRTAALEGGTTGSYAGVVISAPATLMQADISFTGSSASITENGAIVMICGASSARAGVAPSQGIFHNCIHAVFGLWQTSIAVWESDASALSLISYTYPGGALATDGTVYRIKLYLDGYRLGAVMPDGATRYAGEARVSTYTGTNLIYQTYNVTAPNLRPRIEEVWASTDALNLGGTTGVELPY